MKAESLAFGLRHWVIENLVGLKILFIVSFGLQIRNNRLKKGTTKPTGVHKGKFGVDGTITETQLLFCTLGTLSG